MSDPGRVQSFAAQLKAADAAAHPAPWPEEQLVYDDPNWEANYRLIRLLRNAAPDLARTVEVMSALSSHVAMALEFIGEVGCEGFPAHLKAGLTTWGSEAERLLDKLDGVEVPQ